MFCARWWRLTAHLQTTQHTTLNVLKFRALWEFLGQILLEKEFSGQISLERDTFFTNLTSIFKGKNSDFAIFWENEDR